MSYKIETPHEILYVIKNVNVIENLKAIEKALCHPKGEGRPYKKVNWQMKLSNSIQKVLL